MASCSQWLMDFRKICPVDALQFAEVWNHYDSDGNGYIDGDEIDSFFNDLLAMGVKKLSNLEKEKMKEDFMNEFDENRDGKIEMNELAKILPPEDNFLILFRTEHDCISGKVFMTIWKNYATNRKDYIEAGEISSFLCDIFREVGKEVPRDKLEEYARSILCLYDANGDGKLSFKELSRLLPEEENILLKFKDQVNLTADNFDALFSHYDQDGNGSIAGEELDIFLEDVASSISPDITKDAEEFHKLKKMMLTSCDRSGDGSLQKDEIALWLGVEGF